MEGVTQCRLCGARFTEQLQAEAGGYIAFEATGHPLEDAAAWCPACKQAMNHRVDALLAAAEVA